MKKGVNMKNYLGAMVIAGAITLGLFGLMASLVASSEYVEPTILDDVVIDLVEIPEPTEVITKTRVMPEPPKVPEIPDTPTDMPEATDEVGLMGVEGFSVDIGKTSIGAPTMAPVADNDATPVFRVDPKYPMEAVNAGITGWVKLAFDINKVGGVENIKVLEAEPKRIFNRAARNALKRWKYRPKVEGGKAQVQQGLSVLLEFNLEQ